MTISEIIRLYDFQWYKLHIELCIVGGWQRGLIIKSKEDFNIFTDIFGDCDVLEIRPSGASTISLHVYFKKLPKEEVEAKLNEYFTKIGE